MDSLQLALSPLSEGVTDSTALLVSSLESSSEEDIMLHGECRMKGGEDQMLKIANRFNVASDSNSVDMKIS